VTASAATWPTRPCSRPLTTIWNRSASTSPICAVRCVANSKSISATATPSKSRRNAPCGRSAYFGPVWLFSAGCELRQDFRTFRFDQIDGFSVEADWFRPEPGKTLHLPQARPDLDPRLRRHAHWQRQNGLSAVGARRTPVGGSAPILLQNGSAAESARRAARSGRRQPCCRCRRRPAR
jgi:hypothetical protein